VPSARPPVGTRVMSLEGWNSARISIYPIILSAPVSSGGAPKLSSRASLHELFVTVFFKRAPYLLVTLESWAPEIRYFGYRLLESFQKGHRKLPMLGTGEFRRPKIGTE